MRLRTLLATLLALAAAGTLDIFDTVGGRSGYILSTSCEIPPMSKPEIVQWFMDAARTLGRYQQEVGSPA
jgi:uroporphyrinogen-III decarboxylase